MPDGHTERAKQRLVSMWAAYDCSQALNPRERAQALLCTGPAAAPVADR